MQTPLVLLLVSALSGFAAEGMAPVTFQGTVPVTTKTGEVRGIQVRNDSGTPLRAAAIVVHYTDASGKKIRKEVLTQITPKLPEAKLWQPNEVWVFRSSRRSAEDDLQVEYVADYVLAEDGTAWGPDTEKQSEYIRGLLTGLAARRP